MIKGVTVTVNAPSSTTTDRFGNPVITYTASTVDNVLVAPGTTSDLDASRPAGVQVAYSLHFPKSFTGSLEGCEITLPAPWTGTYRVIGAPGQYIEENTPTAWHMPVEVEFAHG